MLHKKKLFYLTWNLFDQVENKIYKKTFDKTFKSAALETFSFSLAKKFPTKLIWSQLLTQSRRKFSVVLALRFVEL